MKDLLSYYEKNAATLCARYENAPVGDLHTLLGSLFPAKAKVLELGSGSGRDGAYMVLQGYDWLGIEGAKAMAAKSLVLHPELTGRVLVQDIEKPFPFPNESFDGAFSIAVLMHLEASAVNAVLLDIWRLLIPSMPLAISVPATREDLDENGFDHEGRYFLPWKEEEWTEALSAAGFTVDSSKNASDSLGREITWLNLVARKCKQAPVL